MKPRYDYTQSLFSFRGRVAELFFVAFVLAVGAELIAHGLVMPSSSETWLGWTPPYLIAVGSALALLGMGFVILRERIAMPKKIAFEGMLIVGKEKNRILRVARYDFSEKIFEYFSGLSENKALLSIWQNGNLNHWTGSGEKDPTNGNLTAAKLIREAIEYFVLSRLSLHLSGHFQNRRQAADGEIEVLGRADIPSILLQNHFLELFSRPMAEREAFATSEDRSPGKVVSVWTSSGMMFEHFEMILPAKSAVTRLNENTILIDTKRFTMRISSGFEGSGYAFPDFFLFWRMYLGKSISDERAYGVNLSIDVKMKPLALLTLTGWGHYRWLDSFLDELDGAFSVDRFLEEIGWKAACTVGQIMNIQRPTRELSTADSKEHVIEVVKYGPESS